MNPSSSQVGAVEYDARIRTATLKKDAAEAEGISRKLNKSMVDDANDTEVKGSNSISNFVKNGAREMAQFALKASVALGAATIAATGFALKSAADFQQTRIGLENMLGSADAARSLLQDVSQFAANTPFEFPELAGATRQLIAFGFSGEDAFKTMKQLGDVSAAVGAPIGDLAYLMGTLKTQGRAFTIDIRQFAQRGIPIYEYLGKTLGVTTAKVNEMIEAGKIGFPEVAKAFESMTSAGGKFSGTMDKQSASLSGRFSTLKDNIGLAARELIGINQQGDVRAGSVFEKVSTAVERVNAALGQINWSEVSRQVFGFASSIKTNLQPVMDYLGPKFGALGGTLRDDLLPAMKTLYEYGIKPLLPILGVLLVGAIGLVTDALNIGISLFSGLINELREGNPFVWAIVGAFTALGTAMALSAAFNALTVGFNTLRLITIPSTMVTLGLFQAMILAPMVMPAIAIGAVLGSIFAVVQAYRDAKSEIEKTNDAIQRNNTSQEDAMKKVIADYKAGKITKAQYQRFFQSISARAAGGPVSAGSPYLVGEKGPELLVPRQSGTIIPNDELAGMYTPGGSSKAGSTIEINVTGVFATSKNEQRRVAQQIADRLREIGVANGKLGGSYG